LLGRYHFLSGKVVGGNRRGRELGFPTANILTRTEVVPANGIYATLTEWNGKRHLSVSSIGTNPTFGEGPRTVETFIFDFDREIYGESLKLLFVKRIRDERRFASVKDLVAQMHDDANQAQAIFHDRRIEPS
jgi:riboflavin kinase/FMN adenylyltransferase